VAPGQFVDDRFRQLPKRCDAVEVPRGEVVEGFKAVFDAEGSQTVG
jgi:hypothetical protein